MVIMDLLDLIIVTCFIIAGIIYLYDTKINFKKRPMGTLAGISFLLLGIMRLMLAFIR